MERFTKAFGIIKNNKGQSMVETALVLPIIVLLLCGIVDFGLLFNNYIIISNASREAARSATLGKTDTEIRTMVSSMTNTLDASKMTVTITPATRVQGDQVTVLIRYNYPVITPVISAVIPNPMPIEAKAVMRVE